MNLPRPYLSGSRSNLFTTVTATGPQSRERQCNRQLLGKLGLPCCRHRYPAAIAAQCPSFAACRATRPQLHASWNHCLRSRPTILRRRLRRRERHDPSPLYLVQPRAMESQRPPSGHQPLLSWCSYTGAPRFSVGCTHKLHAGEWITGLQPMDEISREAFLYTAAPRTLRPRVHFCYLAIEADCKHPRHPDRHYFAEPHEPAPHFGAMDLVGQSRTPTCSPREMVHPPQSPTASWQT